MTDVPVDRVPGNGVPDARGRDDGRIADAKTVLRLQWAALRGPFRR
jgi:hypothetical protein